MRVPISAAVRIATAAWRCVPVGWLSHQHAGVDDSPGQVAAPDPATQALLCPAWLFTPTGGPTSAISLMIADTVAMMAYGDPQRYAHIASLAGGMAALLCLIAWLLRLSVLVRLISDSILVGFEAGAGLTIAMTQVPSLLGVPGGGNNFFERAVLLADQLGRVQYLVLALGLVAILLLVLGERLLPARPVGGLDRLRTLDDLLGSIDR
jgi:Sulfate permease family